MPFSPAQQKAIDIRDHNVLVFASAGSGKTSVLVERLCQLVLKDKISIDSILAMTFTKDAAAEMKTRLKIALENQDPSPYITEQLALLETSSICTIDSFCLSIVQQYYYQIPISLTMANTILDQAKQDTLLQEAYQEACARIDPKAMANLKIYFADFHKTEADIQNAIESLNATAWSKPHPQQWIQGIAHQKPNEQEKWFFTYFKQKAVTMKILLEEMQKQIADPGILQEKIDLLLPCIQALEANDYDAFRTRFLFAIQNTEKLANKYDDIDIKGLVDDYKKKEDEILTKLYPSDFYEKEDSIMQPLIETFCSLCLKTHEIFSKKKAQIEAIDFEDMEHFAFQLLSMPAIAQEVQNRYQMILIDEFQDTNDLQESIVSCFARSNNVFRVGDIKQSIYGFRHAKPEIMKQHMYSQDPYDQTLVLKENYRSNDSIIRFNNDFYAKIMNVTGFSHQFEDIDLACSGMESQRSTKQYPVRFLYSEVDSYVQNNEGINKIKARSLLNKNKLDILAQDILKHKAQGTPYRDICILTRNHNPQQAIKEALEAYDIPVIASIGHGFYTNAAVQVVLACLQALVDPQDDIALCTFLMSELCQVSAQDLAKAVIGKDTHLSLYDKLKDSSLLKDLEELQAYKNEPVCTLIRKIYAHRDFYTTSTTAQDKVNLDRFLQFAAADIDQSLKDFVQDHAQAKNLDATGEASIHSKQADAVSIKTMHQSKGLQFPIVYILSNSNERDRSSSDPVLIDEKLGISFAPTDKKGSLKFLGRSHLAMIAKKQQDEIEEEMRVFYVATTRAQKELVLLDVIGNADDYKEDLSLYTILNKESYTGWFFRTYFGSNDPLVHFEKIQTIYQRPEQKEKETSSFVTSVYSKSYGVLHDQTASKTKASKNWPSIDLSPGSGAPRGTLFHEMVAQLSYPYQVKDLENFALERGMKLNRFDLKQLLALNQDSTYQEYMVHPHQFECSYIVQEDSEIIHGFIDLVIWFEDKITILDFKTDHLDNDQEFIDLYQQQLKTYAKALSQIEKRPIETVIYSFYKQKIINV